MTKTKIETNRETFEHDRFLTDSIITNDLVTELLNNPALLAYYTAQSAYWCRVTDTLKAAYKAQRASIVLAAKAKDSKTPAVTLEALQDADEEVQHLHNRYLIAKEQYDLFSGAVDTLSQKQYSLGSLNSRERREQETTTSAIPSRSTAEDRAERRANVLASQS
jgi:hypothetical protein